MKEGEGVEKGIMKEWVFLTAKPRERSEWQQPVLIPQGSYEQRMQVCQYKYFCFLAHGIAHLYSNNQNMRLQKMIYSFLNIYRPKNPAATESSVTQGLIQSLPESSAPDEAALAAQDFSHPQRSWCKFWFILEAERNRVVFTCLMFLCN